VSYNMITESDVIRIARLARLSLTEKEICRFKDELGRILSFVKTLQEIDVSSLEPMSHAGQVSLRLREDVSGKVLGRECFISSLGYEDGLVRVPKVIE
jgi:aspartyl-tRNA(Asn)/glutamyl-tRNA(Gln) amidotransferase subunit C